METKIIGGKIAEARKKTNLSQAQLAQQLFISPQAVGKWQRGESMPDIVTLNRLAEILGVDLNYFSQAFPSAVTETTASAYQTTKAHTWDMSLGNWVDADFSGLKNLHEKFSGSNMQRCKFIGSEISGLLLKGNHIDSCDFSGSDISGSHFETCHTVNNRFMDCSLKDAEFSGCHMKGNDFTGADFTGAAFKSASLMKNTMANAVLRCTSFHSTDFADTVFEGTLEDCYFENCAFSKVTFQRVTLTNTFFKCKNLKRIRFVECSADRMTYEFLKNGKAELSGITMI